MVEQTNRTKELEAVDASIKQLRLEKESLIEQKNVADAIVRLESNEDYKLAIEKAFIETETKSIMDMLAGDDFVTNETEDALNSALRVIRGFRSFIKNYKDSCANIDSQITAKDGMLKDEIAYRDSVYKGEVDLGDSE